MERHCAACHSLTFDTVAGVARTLRHGSPEDAAASLRDFYQARVVNRVLGLTAVAGAERARPGPAGLRGPPPGQAVFSLANQEAERRVHALFAPRGACFGCHVVTPPADGGLDYSVEPVRLRDNFLPAARFPHAPHETGMTCADCHAAETSANAADVLIPSTESCRTCHASDAQRGRIPTTCADCHGYHALEGHPPMSAEAAPERRASWTPAPVGALAGAVRP
jgi:predicted CXXCH cytochrome family protein